MSEMMLFGVECAALFAGLIFYRRGWLQGVQIETVQKEAVKVEFETLDQKYQSRLESLHHLEKQVASLMELFEVARDFTHCLSFDAMADLLFKKVLPHLPFERMRFILLDSKNGQAESTRIYSISSEGVQEEEQKDIESDWTVLARAIEAKQMIKHLRDQEKGPGSENAPRENWIFPLVIDGEVRAILSVEGADFEDLVKFEVLVAHLVLQVKKISLYETVRELSIMDGLTGVYVRRHFLERLTEEIKRSVKFNLPMSLLMLDIDHFKRYNDEFGHLLGDATLREVAALLRENLRKVDIIARYGGEEFVIIIPDTNSQTAFDVAERIRSSIARHPFKVYDIESKVTVSIGISEFPKDISEEELTELFENAGFDLIRHADKALYRAKEEGRNRVFRYQDL